ncbi:ABC transporter substrate-binding protein [Denitromonas iodatirespirans]|uniref:ABC transporter substrate-binding protein n=1 Tax=Denitromonas iodatirespirans TaxID=2795389 RepID=A0A944H7D7_DENI1|nr:ABC transporter substrate-binding protein [Denitromonas iodatirespirans]MBT0961074.1 ABC transporter substrate-binding protein [Denitromonas iodatirespirans]
MSTSRLPQRIVCLSTETVEVLYALGEEDRIAGISGFTVRPARARKEKPKVSGFSSARIDRILAVRPDLVLAFSDLQADICRDLIRAGVAVHVFNHRDVEGILAMILTVGRLVGATERAEALVADLEARLATARAAGEARLQRLGRRPRVYFEEWDSPMICGIRWVSELIEVAGGEDIFADRAHCHSAGERIIADGGEVLARTPDIILASWCGKKLRAEQIAAREGWAALEAVARQRIHEIKSPLILSPGMAAIEAGLPAIAAALDAFEAR